MTPIRVLNIGHSSVERTFQARLPYIAAEADIDLTVVVPERYKIGPTIIEAYRGDGSYRVITLPTAFGKTARQFAYWFRGLGRVIREVKPDVIYLEQEPEAVSTLQTVMASRSVHPAPKIIAVTWRNLPVPLPGWSRLNPKRYFYPWVQQRTLKHIDVLIQGTPFAEPFFRELGYAGPMPTMPMHGVDEELFFPATDKARTKEPQGSSGFVIGYVGRLIQVKGLEDLIDAVHLINDPECRLLLVGSGEDEIMLRNKAADLGLTDRLIVKNWVPREEIGNVMRTMDVMVLPSRTSTDWREQFGRVIIEAMACGIPVIGSDSGDIPRVIDGHGLIFPERDAFTLAQHLALLKNDPDRRQQLGESGRQYAVKTFSNKVLADRLVSIFRQLANHNERTSTISTAS